MKKRYIAVGVRLCGLLLSVLFGAAGCGQLEFTLGPLLTDVALSKSVITPNADGQDDAAEITYTLRRPADVSIYFENAAGERFYFREKSAPGAGVDTVCCGRRRGQPGDGGLGLRAGGNLEPGAARRRLSLGGRRGRRGRRPGRSLGQITLRYAILLPELQNFTVVPMPFAPTRTVWRMIAWRSVTI